MIPTTNPFVGGRPNGRVPHLSLHLPPEWVSDALCAQTDPELFYPEKGGNPEPARRICGACPVRVECCAYALANAEHHGVWGGLTCNERDRIRARARRTDRPVTEVGRDAA